MATIGHLLHIAVEIQHTRAAQSLGKRECLVLKRGCRLGRQESSVASGEHAVGSAMLLCVVYKPDPYIGGRGMG